MNGNTHCRAAHGDNPASGALDVLQALLTSVPTFWGESEIMQLVQTYIQDCTDESHAESNYMTPLMKTVAKRLPSKTLLPTLSKYWSTATELSGPQVSIIACNSLGRIASMGLVVRNQ